MKADAVEPMYRTEKDRWKLGFKEAVLANFAFLRSLGFTPVAEDVTFVGYESMVAYVNVYHGKASYEVGVEIGRLDHPEKYDLNYIVSWAGTDARAAEGFGNSTMFQVSNKQGVQDAVARVAHLVVKYGMLFIQGDAAFYLELDKAKKMELQHKQMVAQIRKEARAAWVTKDFGRVADLLQPVREELAAFDVKRLQYAEQRLASTTRKKD